MTDLNFSWLFAKPTRFLAFGFGSGLLPKAPGTWGSLIAIPLVLVTAAVLNDWQYALVALVICIVGIPICGSAARDLGIKDHPGIVWDEIAGMFITFLWVPLSPLNLALGFVAFRFFDILKPWPISWADHKLDGGRGIMLDDVMAGIYALICMQGWLYFSPLA